MEGKFIEKEDNIELERKVGGGWFLMIKRGCNIYGEKGKKKGDEDREKKRR